MTDEDDATAAAQPTPAGQRLRIQAYVDAETDARIRNAYLALGSRKGYSSLGELLVRAALTEVARWEAEENGGQPFDAPTSTRHFGAGRKPRPGITD